MGAREGKAKKFRQRGKGVIRIWLQERVGPQKFRQRGSDLNVGARGGRAGSSNAGEWEK